MATAPLNQIFLGHTPSEQRKYIYAVLKHLRERYPKIVIPAAGQFTLAKCAIEAGYKKENIYTSDISLYSTLLGFLFSNRPIADIKWEFADGELKSVLEERYQFITNDAERVAFLMWVMKLAQLSKVHYQKLLFEDLMENHVKHVADLLSQVIKLKNYFEGINYKVEDLRDELLDKRDPETVMIVNPPVFRKGYTKMFDFRGYLNYHSGVEEFDFQKEYNALYEESKRLSYPVIWYRFRSVDGFKDEEVIYAKEYEVEKQDYWLITKPDVLKDFPYYKHIASFKRKNLRPSKYPLFGKEDVITEHSKVRFVSVPEEVALYYRDLFAHRLGNTGAEHYYLMLVDDKVFSTCGFTTSKLFRLQSKKVFENFGFSVSVPQYPSNNRLLMLMITCKEFGETIRNTTSSKNRIWTCEGMKTTCLSKYRSIKTHQGILQRVFREQMDNGMYKIQAECTWHDRDFAQTLKIWLEEQKTGKKVLTSETMKEE